MKRGEVWVANLNPNRGREVGKIRPVLVIQADFLTSQGSAGVVVLPLTTQVDPRREPLRLTLAARDQLQQTSQVMTDQPRTLDRDRFGEGPLTRLTAAEMNKVEEALLAVLGIY